VHYKRNCKELEISVFKPFEIKMTEILDEDDDLPELLINDKIGEHGARALFNAFKSTK
jgi:hypothetical protein